MMKRKLFASLVLVAGVVVQVSLAQQPEAVKADNVATPAAPAVPAVTAAPADAPQGKLRIGVGAVKIIPSLEQQLAKADQLLEVRRAEETIESQLTNALQNTHKFEIIARSDLAELFKEQSLDIGVVDAADPKKATPGRVKGLQYLAVTTIDDFADVESSLFSPEMGFAVSKRVLRMSANVRVYNTTTGVLMESMIVPVQLESTGTARAAVGDKTTGGKPAADSVYVALVNQLAMAVSQRVVDAVYPAKIIAVTGSFVTLNRGLGTPIGAGQVWEVFSAGAAMKDPDTGETLGHEEMKVGEVVITDVLPKFSKAQMYGENRGMSVGAILRPKLQQQQQPQPATATTR